MEKTFEGIFELFQIQVRRLENGNKLRLIFEDFENLEVEKSLIEFRGNFVKAIIDLEKEEGEITKTEAIEDEFEVFEVSCRRLGNGDKLRFILEAPYKKQLELRVVELREENCKIFMEKIEQELDFEKVDLDEKYGDEEVEQEIL